MQTIEREREMSDILPDDSKPRSTQETRERATIDWERPIFAQICEVDDYWALISRPPAAPLKRPATLFQNPVLEAISRTHWYMVPAVWIPVAARLCVDAHRALSWQSDVPSVCLSSAMFSLGFFSWTLLEYIFHRFIFHHQFRWMGSAWGRRVHFLLHGIHHMLPSDPLRLVFPPLLTAPVFVSILLLLRTLLSFAVPWVAGEGGFPSSSQPIEVDWAQHKTPQSAAADLLAAGLLVGYVAYDLVHFWLHHARSPSTEYLRRMKRHHMHHHFRNQRVHFGITCKAWDSFFHTLERTQ